MTTTMKTAAKGRVVQQDTVGEIYHVQTWLSGDAATAMVFPMGESVAMHTVELPASEWTKAHRRAVAWAEERVAPRREQPGEEGGGEGAGGVVWSVPQGARWAHAFLPAATGGDGVQMSVCGTFRRKPGIPESSFRVFDRPVPKRCSSCEMLVPTEMVKSGSETHATPANVNDSAVRMCESDA